MTEDKELEIGDCVILNSGSPIFTIVDIYKSGQLCCMYINKEGEISTVNLSESCVTTIVPDSLPEYVINKYFTF